MARPIDPNCSYRFVIHYANGHSYASGQRTIENKSGQKVRRPRKKQWFFITIIKKWKTHIEISFIFLAFITIKQLKKQQKTGFSLLNNWENPESNL